MTEPPPQPPQYRVTQGSNGIYVLYKRTAGSELWKAIAWTMTEQAAWDHLKRIQEEAAAREKDADLAKMELGPVPAKSGESPQK